jgi:Ni/Co efflux regulator RcnB
MEVIMKKILIALLLALSLLSVACSAPASKDADKRAETASTEKTEEKDKADDKKAEEDTQEESGDMKDKVNIKYFDDFKDGELLAIANITNNSDKEDLFAAYNVKELLLSENDDAKEYLIIPKEDKTDLIIKEKDSEGDGESFTLGKKFGLKLAISDADLEKFVFTIKNGDNTKDFSMKLKEDGSLDLDKEIIEVVFK